MQTHTTLGADAILRAIHDHMEQPAFECLKIAAIIARSHHEKWDGTGYPDGLAGEAIPLPARLMALADVFDALISRRTYKDAMSMASASAIIVEGRGTHFDPAIVDAFMRCQDDFAAIAQRYADNNVD